MVTKYFVFHFAYLLKLLDSQETSHLEAKNAELENEVGALLERMEYSEYVSNSLEIVIKSQVVRLSVLENMIRYQGKTAEEQHKHSTLLEETIKKLVRKITLQDKRLRVAETELKHQDKRLKVAKTELKHQDKRLRVAETELKHQLLNVAALSKELRLLHESSLKHDRCIPDQNDINFGDFNVTVEFQNYGKTTAVDNSSTDNSKAITVSVANNIDDFRGDKRRHHSDATTSQTVKERSFPSTSGSRVAFTAYLDKTISHLQLNQTIPFDKVLLNDGNAFNVLTHTFVCPQSGVYLFSFNIESYGNEYIHTKLVIDGENQLDAVTWGTHATDMSGNTAVLRVLTGQSVWVATYYRDDAELFKTDTFRYTSFTGVLLY